MVAEPATVALPPKTAGALTRYRVMAYVTGTLLVVLVLVAMPLKYAGGIDGPTRVIGMLHGFLYPIYLVAAFWLALQARWSAKATILVLLAGTIPFVSFYAERKVTSGMRAGRRL